MKTAVHPQLTRLSGITASVWALLLLISVPQAFADNRDALLLSSYPWLQAVGKLQVPGSRIQQGRRTHHREDCSATLVSRKASTSANTIITAWHCLEFYNDLSRPILFTLHTLSGSTLNREAYRLADGGGMHADWALLRLYKAVSASDITAMPLGKQQADSNRPIVMAGYSRDKGIKGSGQQLNFDPHCSITHQNQRVGDTDCIAHKGASGGAVIQVSDVGEAVIYGVISEGNGSGRSTFVPVSHFKNATRLYVN